MKTIAWHILSDRHYEKFPRILREGKLVASKYLRIRENPSGSYAFDSLAGDDAYVFLSLTPVDFPTACLPVEQKIEFSKNTYGFGFDLVKLLKKPGVRVGFTDLIVDYQNAIGELMVQGILSYTKWRPGKGGSLHQDRHGIYADIFWRPANRQEGQIASRALKRIAKKRLSAKAAAPIIMDLESRFRKQFNGRKSGCSGSLAEERSKIEILVPKQLSIKEAVYTISEGLLLPGPPTPFAAPIDF